MTLSYPAWWKGGRWDVERLIRDLFTYTENGAAQGLSGVQVEPWNTWIHLDAAVRDAWLEAGNAYLLVHRMGGHVSRRKEQWVDVSIVTIGALTQSRDRSNELMAYVTDVLVEFDEGGDIERETPHRSGATTTFLTVPGEVVGPQLQPEQIGDDRLIPATWELHVDRPRGLPDSKAHLGLDW